MIQEARTSEYLRLSREFLKIGDRIDSLACALTAVRLDPDSQEAQLTLERAARRTGKAPVPPSADRLREKLQSQKRMLDSALLKEAFLALLPPEKCPVDPSAVLGRTRDSDSLELRRDMARLLQRLERDATEKGRRFRQKILAILRSLGPPSGAGEAEGAAECPEEEGEVDLSLQHEIHNLGNSFYKMGRLDEAVACYNMALEISPDLLETLFNRGLAHTRIMRYEAATEDLTRVIQLNPNLAEAYYTRGLVWEYRERFDEAIADYDRALGVDPNYEKARSQRETAREKKRGQGSGSPDNSPKEKEGRIGDFSFCLVKSRESFAQVGGCRKAKRVLQMVVHHLRGDPILRDWGAELPGGVLMVGPPGTGKTQLVRGLSGEAGCPCYAPPPTIFQDMWAGNTEKNIRTLWEQASAHEKAIIFIDELDGLACRRTDTRSNSSETFYNRTIVTLLDLMDGLRKLPGRLVVVGATNRVENIDPAFLRPGRFDYVVAVDLPDARDLAEIWLIHLAGAEKRAARRDFLEEGLRRAVRGERDAFLGEAFGRGPSEPSGIVRLALLSEKKGLTGADVRELIRRVVNDRVLAGIECSVNLGPIGPRDLEIAVETYERAEPSSGGHPSGGRQSRLA